MSQFHAHAQGFSSQTEEEIMKQVPDATCVLVVDAKGKITTFPIGEMTLHQHEEDNFPVRVQSIEAPPTTVLIMPVHENPHCIWVTCGTGTCCFRPKH
jgi:hypothetical protein